jgi:hypothetical protein
MVAKGFAEHPKAITMEANSKVDSHLLFTTVSDELKRDSSTLQVAMEYLHGFIVQEIASIDVAKQTSFYS